MDKQLRARRATVRRMVAVGAFFVLCCVLFLIRLGTMELTPENIGGHPQNGTIERSVVVTAVRGQVYDRNGKALVTNRYIYDLVFDYMTFPKEPAQRNAALLDTLAILGTLNEGGAFVSNDPPFEGTYPQLSYTAAATDPSTSAYDTLIAQIKTSGLRKTLINQLRRDGMTMKQAETAFDEAPLTYATAEVLADYFVKEYALDTEAYTDIEIHRLIQVYWGMEVTGFSRVNDYTVAADVTMAVITHAKEKGIPGIGFATHVQRVYEYPGYASHILGQTGPIYAEDWEAYKALGYSMNAMVGVSGCEAAFESYLHGQDGVMVIVEDADGYIVEQYMKKEPVAGKDVYLTIDIDLQIAAEDGLKENVEYASDGLGHEDCKAGALTALDPNTGEVLALASYPTYDLTTYNADYNSLVQADGSPLLNRALNGLYAPGSTFKPGMVAAALSEGKVTAGTLLPCDGVYTYAKDGVYFQADCWVYNSISDSIDRHGHINAATALEVSCNCYFYEVGQLLGVDVMNEYCRHYGLGQPTGIELGEAAGILAGKDYREAIHGVAWNAADTSMAAIGQSDNAFTPLQLSVYTATLLNGGTRYGAHLLSRVVDVTTGETVVRGEITVVDQFSLNESYRAEIVDGMERVITSSSSLTRYFRDLPVQVAAKTGTAQVGGGQDDNGLFVCGAPSHDPEIVVTSVLERCGGGSYAALAASRVLEAYYVEP